MFGLPVGKVRLQGKTSATLRGNLALVNDTAGQTELVAPTLKEIDSGFDIVIGNPPYIGHKGGKKALFSQLRASSLGKRFNNERMDLFYYFFHVGIDLAASGGIIALITTNYYVTADSGIKLRRDMQQRTAVLQLINFNELKIFESAVGQHNIVTILVKQPCDGRDCHLFVTRRVGAATPEVLSDIFCRKDSETLYRQVPQNDLFQGDMLYISNANAGSKSSGSIENVLQKMIAVPTTLGDFCDVSQGIVTGLDRITERHVQKLPSAGLRNGQGGFVISRDEYGQFIKPDPKIVKPWFKNSDISKYVTNMVNNHWLIYSSAIDDIHADSPVCKHLRRLKPAIELRNYDSGELSRASRIGHWWALSSARREFDFSKPKIVAPQRCYANSFGYNDGEWYASGDVYFIVERDPSVSLKYVLALLNSSLFFCWLYFKGKRKGEMLELYQKPLSLIPLLKASQAIQAAFELLVDKVITAKRSDPEADTSALEREIDEKVYRLYGLTSEEIGIVEYAAK
ncbi:MAG: Eco57I restriction-modification methylase domain-containing protein [Planctomycetia bacterium]|nr:Eco57I restriction-modification methylase domain-containing protein [Planctomycetia bacterium]